MAGVHGGEEVETFRATDFAENDTVRTHTQGVLDEIADGDGALALKVRGAGFEWQPVRLLQAQLGRVLDSENALAWIDHLRQGVEHGRLTRTGAARNDDVHPACARDLQCGTHLFAHRTEVLEHVERDRLFGEFTNGNGRAAQTERRHDDVDARSILEARVGQRRGLIDAAADLVHDTLGNLEEVGFIAELDRRDDQFALLLNICLVGSVHHDVRHVGIIQQLFERAKSQQLVDQHFFERKLFAAV